MRPLQLKLKGINSYREEQIIDFETLTSQGLFGIFGPTGSGKSTILDAMTLALYAKLPRDTKNFINTNETKAAVSFLFSITTDKTRKYLAERSFRYHTSGSTSTVRNTTGRLILYEGENETVLADKPTDVTTECINLLGLTSEDFMRTVVLPQGQFSEFLRLKNRERRVMLQRIFHLEKYGMELTGKIARARQKQDLLLSKLEGEKKGYDQISSRKLSELKKEKKANAKQQKSLSKKLVVLNKSFEETKEIFAWQQELHPLEEKNMENQKLLPSIKEQEQQLDAAKKAAQLHPFSIQASNAKTAYEQALAKLQSIQEEVRILNTDFEKIKKEQEAASTAQKKELPSLQTKEQLLKAALSAAATIHDWGKSKDTFQKELRAVTDSLSPLKEKQEQLLNKEQALHLEIQATEKFLEEDRINSERKQLLTDGNILEQTYRDKHQNYNKNVKALTSLKTAIEKDSKAFTLQQADLHSVYENLSSRLSYLNRQYIATSKTLDTLNKKEVQNEQQQKVWQQEHMAQLLREELEEGTLCPVCGTPYEEHHSEHASLSPSSASLNSLKEEQKDLEKKKKQQQILLQQLDKDRYSLTTHLSSLKDALEITEDFASKAILEESSSEEIPEEEMASDSSNALNISSTQQTSSYDLSPDYSSISRQISAYLQAKGDLRRQKEQYDTQATALQEEHSILQKHAEKIFALRKETSIDNFSEALEELRQKEQNHQQKEELIKKKRQLLDKLLSEKKIVSDDIVALENNKSSLLANIENCEKVIAEQTERFPESFSVDTDFSSEIATVQKQQQAIQIHFKETEECYNKKADELQKKREGLGSCESASRSAQQHLDQTSQLYLSQKEKLGFSEEDQPEQYYLEEKQLHQMQESITSYYDAARKTEERISYLQEKLSNRKVEESEWLRQQEELNTMNQEIKDLESSSLLLDHQIEDMTEKLAEKQKLEEKWDAETHKKSMIRELEQLFKGNAFIEYVAQSKLAYIAREASVILSNISGGNYALEINESAEFIIRDNKNGGAVRPSDTLSGGELFITSLSLALALSSSIQLNGAAPLEFFFLDEGFGSLDDDLLDTVMSSLERLQSKKRSIGIISHVETIQARVPLKLLVTPSDLSQTGSQIKLEYS